MVDETEYDDQIVNFLEEEKRYICHDWDTVFTRQRFENLDVDVCGIKDLGGKYKEKIELVGVEVKATRDGITDGIRKALYYTKFVHKSYLAAPLDLKENQIYELEKLGIGYLKLNDNKVEEVITPRIQDPSPEKTENFLNDKLFLSPCIFCGFHFWDCGEYIKFKNFSGKKKELAVCDSCKNFLNNLKLKTK